MAKLYYAEVSMARGSFRLVEVEVKRETDKSYILANGGYGEVLVGSGSYVAGVLRKSTLGPKAQVFAGAGAAVAWLAAQAKAVLATLDEERQRVQEVHGLLQRALTEALVQTAVEAVAEGKGDAAAGGTS